MRRLLVAIVTLSLFAGLTLEPAAEALAAGRVPSGVRTIRVALTDPLKRGPGAHRPVYKTLTRASTVAAVVAATRALPVAKQHGVCPMIMRIGPDLTVSFRNAAGTTVAQAQVEVAIGSSGQSGSTPCFPIRLVSSGKLTDLLGNSWVRMIGRLIGVTIS